MTVPDGSPIKATIVKSTDEVEAAMTDIVETVEKSAVAVDAAVVDTAERTGLSEGEVRRLIDEELSAREARVQPTPTGPAADAPAQVETASHPPAPAAPAVPPAAAPAAPAAPEPEPESVSPGKTGKRGRRQRDTPPSTSGSLAARFFRGR